MEKLDYKKEYKDLYMPKTKPMIIDVPEMTFIMVDGKGDPNTCVEYKSAMEILYGLSFSIKMSKMSGRQPVGYFEYVVPPLEGFWWTEGEPYDGVNVKDKNKFIWTAMIRQPEFVSPEVFQWAREELAKKKPEVDSKIARLVQFNEGLCGQVMHIGSYDEEPETIEKLEQFIRESGYVSDLADERKHHEIYLSDPRKTAPEKLKTVIRHPIRKQD
ncbi:MAG: GyrI-like domain-containing protein [Lachnospiraceae bacterium]